jgi:hypothetical protein
VRGEIAYGDPLRDRRIGEPEVRQMDAYGGVETDPQTDEQSAGDQLADGGDAEQRVLVDRDGVLDTANAVRGVALLLTVERSGTDTWRHVVESALHAMDPRQSGDRPPSATVRAIGEENVAR